MKKKKNMFLPGGLLLAINSTSEKKTQTLKFCSLKFCGLNSTGISMNKLKNMKGA